MHILIAIGAAIVWLYFWLRGHWFAAVLASGVFGIGLCVFTQGGWAVFWTGVAIAWVPYVGFFMSSDYVTPRSR